MYLSLQILLLASITTCSSNAEQMNLAFGQVSTFDPYIILGFDGGETICLENNNYLNGRGEWADYTTYLWDCDWLQYNCYSYAIQRFDQIPYYYFYRFGSSSPDSDRWYVPGRISDSINPIEYTTVDSVVSDLNTIGFSNVHAVPLNQFNQNDLGNNEEAIAMRYSFSENAIHDYHFMRYDKAEGCWYHKPGNGAVLKYKHTFLNDIDSAYVWDSEYINNNGYNNMGFNYDSDITIIVFEPNHIELAVGGQEVMTRANAFYDHDSVVWLDVLRTGIVSIEATWDDYAIFKMFDERWNEIYDFDLSSPFIMSSGRYYLTFKGLGVDDEVTIMAHCHSNLEKNSNECSVCNQPIHPISHSLRYYWKNLSRHAVSCQCGLFFDEPHVVMRPGLINSLRTVVDDVSSLIGTCVLCGNVARMTSSEDTDDIVYLDTIEQLESVLLNKQGNES